VARRKGEVLPDGRYEDPKKDMIRALALSNHTLVAEFDDSVAVSSDIWGWWPRISLLVFLVGAESRNAWQEEWGGGQVGRVAGQEQLPNQPPPDSKALRK
jgi:hypothetical protein